MWKIKKIFQTIIIFVGIMLLFCLIFSFASTVLFKKSYFNILNSGLNYFLYSIGYSNIDNSNIVQCIFAVFGIVSTSLMSTFLTINLFWRVDDVVVSNNLAIYKRKNNMYYVSMLIGNKGRNICKLEVTFITYDGNGNVIIKCEPIYTYPLLVSKAIWKLDILLNNGFFYDTLRTIRKKNISCKIYATFSYVDTKTGQESIKVKEYTQDDIYFTNYDNGFLSTVEISNSNKWKQFKKVDINRYLDDIFTDWISGNTIPFNLREAKPINKGNIMLFPDIYDVSGRNSLSAVYSNDILRADINFEINKGNVDFAMALLTFDNNYQDWTCYYRDNAFFQLEIAGSDEICYIYLEIKDDNKRKIIDEKIEVTEIITSHVFRLRDYGDEELFSKIDEICFTIFPSDMIRPKGEFTIYSCEIALPCDLEDITTYKPEIKGNDLNHETVKR